MSPEWLAFWTAYCLRAGISHGAQERPYSCAIMFILCAGYALFWLRPDWLGGFVP